ncbi:Protein of unknown function [Mucilaginibacter pineti]|uniref:DUF3999 domain-containing protein n=1 Tax=Mucilaginibacter pineti TaxID=1391627 RepID=A0A1G7DLV6_9SPHI|nr:DUF3999 family protein [Mucilaginibacter pineti]SDE52534.1 Protein of unknown function [Mucilaginibacter pineti]
MRLKTKTITRSCNIAVLILLFFASIKTASAQKTFKYGAALQQVDSTGFYRINLQPALVAKAKADLSDIRIADGKGNFVPYIQAGSLPQKDQKSFVVFNTIATRLPTDTGTTFIVENKTGLPLDRLWIKLQNTAVQRQINLIGSDDLQQWFAIQENIPLQEAVQNSEGTYMQSLSFPASSYRYLKLLVNDKRRTPIKFLQAGIYTDYAAILAYTQIIPVQFSRVDSNKTTFINLKLNDNYQVNKLHLNISGPKYFKRNITIYQLINGYKETVAETEISATQSTDVLISAKTNQLILQVNNGDNPPLTIKSIDVYQSDEYLISYLEGKQSYRLLTGDSSALAAEYDLKFFADSIKDNTPLITHDAVIKNNIQPPAVVKKGRDYTVFIWIAIVVSLGLLLFLTLKMTKEVGKKTGER